MMAAFTCQVVGLLLAVTGVPRLGVSHHLGHVITSPSTPAHIIQQTCLVEFIHVVVTSLPEQQEGKTEVQSTLNLLLMSYLLKYQ